MIARLMAGQTCIGTVWTDRIEYETPVRFDIEVGRLKPDRVEVTVRVPWGAQIAPKAGDFVEVTFLPPEITE